MDYILCYLAGILTVFGLIGILNFVFHRLAMKAVKDDALERHLDAVEHWKRIEEALVNIGCIMKLVGK